MKSLTKTVHILKENDRFFKESEINTKEVLSNIVEYSNYINKLINAKSLAGEDSQGILVEG